MSGNVNNKFLKCRKLGKKVEFFSRKTVSKNQIENNAHGNMFSNSDAWQALHKATGC